METISQNEFIKRLSKHARANDIPVNGNFELTPLCNLDCKMCYIHLTDATVKAKMLSGKQWIAIMQQAIDKGMVNAMLTGGEAMTHPDFWEIYEYLIRKGVLVRIKTNGLLLNEETIKRLIVMKPTCIDISLYGCNSESYLAVTGHDVYETVIANIHAAKAAGLAIRLMVTPSRYMQPWVEDIMQLAKSLDVHTNVNGKLFSPKEDTGRELADFDLTTEEYLQILRRGIELFPREKPMKDDDCPEPDKKTTSVISEIGLRCGGGRFTFAAHWDGTMTPCLMFPQEMICENLKNTAFADAWENINRQVKEFVTAKECLTCSYREKCAYCPAKHGKYAFQRLCDPNACDFSKALIDMTE